MSRLRALYREPLVHFLLIGVLLFVAYDTGQQETDAAPDRILVDGGKIEQLAAQFERSRLRPPTEAELLGLIEGEVRDEVYYREARGSE